MKPLVNHRNRIVEVSLEPLVEGRLEQTIINADEAAGQTAITVKDIDGFAVNQILLIGELGSETSEIVKTHASTAPTGTTVTLAAATEFAHSAGTKIYRIEFDQVEISHAATIGGSKSVLTTTNLGADEITQRYLDTSQTSGFYFARFKETIGNTFSSYSTGIPYGGWATSQFGYLMEQALRNNKVDYSDDLTRDDLFDFGNQGLKLIQGKQVRWPQHQNLNAIIGQTTMGIGKQTLPTDIYDNDSLKSIMGVRIGEGTELEPLDPKEFEAALGDTTVTQVRTEASATDTTLELDNSYDFDDSGSVNVYISGTKYNITYTGVTRDDADGGTAVLSGIPASGTGAITVTIPVDTYVWQDEEVGEPTQFTVRNGNLEYYPLPDSRSDNKNVYMDYFTVATEISDDGDTIDLQRFDMLLDYVTWRVRMKVKNNGQLDMGDGWYTSFKERLNDAIRTSRSPFIHKMKPKVNRIAYKAPFANRFRNTSSDD